MIENAKASYDLQNALSKLGAAIAPALTAIATAATGLLNTFNSFDASTQKVILTIGGLLAALGPLLMMVGQIMGAVKLMGPVFAALTGPIGIAVAAIAGITAALVVLYNKNETVRNALDTAWNAIKDAAESIFGAIKDFWDRWGDDIVHAFRSIWNIVSTLWRSYFDMLFTIVRSIFGAIRIFFESWGAAIKTFFEGVWNNIRIAFETATNVISGIVKTFLALFRGDWEGAWEGAKQTVQSAWHGIQAIFSNSFNAMRQIGTQLMQGLFDGITSMAQTIYNKAQEIASRVINTIKSALQIQSPSRVMEQLGEYTGEGFALGLEESIRAVKQQAAALASAATGEVTMFNGRGGGVGTILVNVTGNYIQSPADEDRLAEKISQKIAGAYGLSSGGAW
jgi:phage-related protein